VAEIMNNTLIGIYNEPLLSSVQMLNCVHDSIVFQIPLKLGIDYMAMAIRRIAKFIEVPLQFRSSKPFFIPTDCEVGVTLNKKKMVKVKPHSELLEDDLYQAIVKVKEEAMQNG